LFLINFIISFVTELISDFICCVEMVFILFFWDQWQRRIEGQFRGKKPMRFKDPPTW